MPLLRRIIGERSLLYLAWVSATYLLEGRILTLLRPEATSAARLVYALVANILIGILGAARILRILIGSRVVTPEQAGFRGGLHALASVLVGAVLGFLFYLLQGPPALNPVVITNAFAQVSVVSVAEVVVCWSVIGSVCESLLRRQRRKWAPPIVAALVASVLFGIYHLAHSPPFDAIPLVLLLTGIGLVTSLFYFVSWDVYGTVVFHDFSGIFGVIQALQSAGMLTNFERQVLPLLVMAVTGIFLIIAHALILK